jgi:hypothetical protein
MGIGHPLFYILLVKKRILRTNTDKLSRKLLGTTWLAGNSSCTLVIPKSLAREYGIDQPSNIVIEGRPDGILIRKMEI